MAREVDSIGVQKQLNALFENRLGVENQILNTMQQELKVAMQLQAVMKDLSAEQLNDQLGEANKAFEALASKATETGDIGAKSMDAMSKSTKAVSSNAGMLQKTFGGIAKVMGSFQSTALGVLGSMLKIGKAILSIPLDIFNNLMADAAAMSGDPSFGKALEAIRKDFGSFQEDVSKNIVGAYKTVNTQLQAMSGLSVWQVFETPAEQLKYLHEIASKAGPMMHKFGSEMAAAGGAITVFDKGMGIGAENMKGFMTRAAVLGTDMQTQLTSVGNYALQMGKAFGLSSKTISSAIGVMMKDVKNFGSLTPKEMATATVYTQKLGIAMKDILGTIDKFDNFDKAAESSAMLSQAFGATVDAFAMMNEQNPAKRMDEMRKAMSAAGQTSEGMTRQQLKLLASTTGLTEEAAQLAFSTKNQGLTYEQVQKQAGKAESAQMTQAKVMKGLSDNIERVVRSGEQIAGFWKNFVAGFERGFKMTSEYRDLMFTLKNAMRQFYVAGMEVGQMFMKVTPGISESFKSLTAVFSADKIKKLLFGFTGQFDAMNTRLGGVVGGFKKIFQGNLEEGFDTIKQSFASFFTSAQTGPILNGMMKFGQFLAKSLGEALSAVAKNAPIYIDQLTAFIKNPQGFIDSMKRSGGEAGGMFKAILLSFDKGFSKNGPVMKKLKDSLEKLLTAVWEMIKESPMIREAAKDFFLFNLGKMMMGNIGGLASATTNIVGMFKKSSDAAAAATKEMTKAGEAATKSAGEMGNAAGGATKMQSAMGGLKAAAVGLGVGLAVYEGILHSGMATWDEMTKKCDEAAKSFLKFREEQARVSKGGKITQETMDISAKTAGDVTEEVLKASQKLADLEKNAKLSGKYNVGGETLNRFFKSSDFEAAKAALENAQAREKAYYEGRGELDKKLLAQRQATAAEGAKSLLAGFEFSPEVLAQIDKSHQSLEDQFDKTAAGMAKKAPEYEANRKKFMLENMAKMGQDIENHMQANGVEIQKLAEKQAREIVGAQATAERFAEQVAEQKKTITAQKMAEAPSNAGGLKVDIEGLMSQKRTLEENIGGLTKFVEGGIIAKLNVSLPKAGAALDEFNTKLSTSTLNTAISATQGIVKSINELNTIIGSGDNASMKIGEKLQRFANNSGLGKTGSYEIKNKGIMLKLDLKITMDAGEVEKAIVLRKESILFDALFDKTAALTPQHEASINAVNAAKGGT